MEVLERILHVSFTGGIGILLFYTIFRMFGKKFHAKARKRGWILIAIYLCFPFELPKFENSRAFEIPEIVLYEQGGMRMEDALLAGKIGSSMDMPVLMQSNPKVMVSDVFFLCWILAIILLSMYNVIGYWIMYHRNLYWSMECCDETIISRMMELAKEIQLRKLPSLRIIKDRGRGPFTVGVVKKIIFLPEGTKKGKDLDYILKHEIMHCKENDNFWKVFFLVVHIIHWFNPLVWLMRKWVDQDMEFTCDEGVTKDSSWSERKEYSGVLINCLERQEKGKHRDVFSADYTAGMHFMERRFDHIFDRSAKRSGRALVGIFIAVLWLVSSMTGLKMEGIFPSTDIRMEDFWNVVEEGENTWRFATGLEITFPEGWNGKIVTETDCWPTPVPAHNILVICEKTNAEAGVGGDLFYLRFNLYQGSDMVLMMGTVLGLYERDGKTYVLTLALPGSLSYVEGNEERRASYEELSMQLGAVRINTDRMQGFIPCGIDDLEWLHDESWLNPH